MGNRNKIIGYWLMIGVGMLVVQIFLGGVTRLTGSGLSITEWKAVMGALPPMNAHDWNDAFEKYKQFDQYKLVNSAMTLADFKKIFFWEYTHRLWARFMALCAFLPMLYFIYKKILKPKDVLKIVFIIMLGALEGLVGWIMVASGLEENKVLVNPVKLMLHLLIASGIIALTFRFSIEYLFPKHTSSNDESFDALVDAPINPKPSPAIYATGISPQARWLLVLLCLVFIQISFGALVAGSKAALNATDWPLMNGSYLPPHFGFLHPWEDHIHENNLMLQFLHRNTAYIITIFSIILFVRLNSVSKEINFIKLLLFSAVLIQITLGISTLIFTEGKVPVFWGELHQLGAYFVLLSSVAAHYFVKYRNFA